MVPSREEKKKIDCEPVNYFFSLSENKVAEYHSLEMSLELPCSQDTRQVQFSQALKQKIDDTARRYSIKTSGKEIVFSQPYYRASLLQPKVLVPFWWFRLRLVSYWINRVASAAFFFCSVTKVSYFVSWWYQVSLPRGGRSERVTSTQVPDLNTRTGGLTTAGW